MSHPSAIPMYEQMNLLPQWYTQQQRRRRSRNHQIALIVVMALAMGVMWHTAARHRSRLVQSRELLAGQRAEVDQQIDRMTQLQVRKQQLSRQVGIYRQLYLPISYSQIAGTLASLTPESVTLSELEIRTKTDTATQASSGQGPRRGQKHAATSSSADLAGAIRITAQGTAPSDAEIADFVALLSEHGLFQNVKIRYSKKTRVREVSARRFALAIDVPLDRNYASDDQAKEVARAH